MSQFFKMLGFLYFSIIFGLSVAHISVQGYVHKSAESRQLFGGNCEKQYSSTCFKLDMVSFIEKFSKRSEYQILPSVSLVREGNSSDTEAAEMVAEIVRSYPNDTDKRLNSYLFAKISNFLQSHTFKIKLMDQETAAEARSAFTGRKKIGKKGGLEAILAAGMMMKGTLMAIAMGGIALLAGKALLTGLMALMLAGITGLKSLTSGGKQTTYEIVAKPVYSSTHSHSVSHEDAHGHGGGGGGGGHGHSGYAGYGRSLNLELPEHLRKPT